MSLTEIFIAVYVCSVVLCAVYSAISLWSWKEEAAGSQSFTIADLCIMIGMVFIPVINTLVVLLGGSQDFWRWAKSVEVFGKRNRE